MFAATAVFVLILFAADGSITYVPGWHTFRACSAGKQVIMGAAENLYTTAPKRPVAAYCVAQFGTGEESAP